MGGKPRLGASSRSTLSGSRPPSAGSGGYSKTPLPQKLGIRPGYEVAMIGAPPHLRESLVELAPAARFVTDQTDDTALVMWFVDGADDLARDAADRAARTPEGGIWICWRKKTADPDAEVGEADVRAAGLAHRIVDYKIASIDDTWSGLKFAVRRTK